MIKVDIDWGIVTSDSLWLAMCYLDGSYNFRSWIQLWNARTWQRIQPNSFEIV